MSVTDAISKTALLTAAARALESTRPDALFRDPWAEALAGDEGKAMLEATGSPRPKLALAVRTRFFDDVVREAAPRVSSVVMLASGLDTRAYRMDLPEGARPAWFEIDRAEVHAHKAACLARATPTAASVLSVSTIAADVASDFFPRLAHAGFDAQAPALFVAEGLLMYLSPNDARALIERIAARAVIGTTVAFDVPSSIDRGGAMARHHRDLDAQGAGWRFATDTPSTLFDPARWQVEVLHLGHPRAHFGRWPMPASETPPPSATLLVVARCE